MRRAAIRLRTQQPSEPLRLLLARAKGAGDLNGDIGVWQVNGEVCHFADDQPLDFTTAEAIIELFALRVIGAPAEQWCIEQRRQILELVEILADDEYLIVGVAVQH